MIGRLRGLLIQKQPGQALVECGGVGYVCAISLGTYGLLPEPGVEVVLQVETLLRENDLSLLGFATIPLLLGVAVLFGTSRAFMGPAGTAMGPMLVPRSLLQRAQSLGRK